MRLAINALFLRTKVAGGTETYVTNIVRPWYDQGPGETSFELIANHTPEWWEGDRPWFTLRRVETAGRLPQRILHEQLLLARESRTWDGLFSPGYVGVVRARCPQVITVHDAYAWVMRREAGWARTLYWRRMIRWSMHRASLTIAVSESTRRDLLRWVGVPPHRVRTILEAGDHVPLRGDRCQPVEAVDSGVPYFLSIGFFKAVKNPTRTLEAFARYRKERIRKGEPACRLKLVGAVLGRDAEAVRSRALATEGVEVLGRLEDSALAPLLAGAWGFLFPSLYEGFGIPILEAQRAGCPVLTSTTSSMPEVAGDGAILIDPLDVSALEQGLHALHDPDLRAHLVRRGFANAARFSWRSASAKTLEALLEAAGARGSSARPDCGQIRNA